MLKLWTFPRTLGGMCCGRLVCLIVLASLAVVTGFASPEALAQTADPQSLVGAWLGTWAVAIHPDIQGEYNMTVTKVEGNQVHGRVERTAGWAAKMVPAASFNIVGTLDGDTLAFAGPGNTAEVTIYRTSYGTVMKGTSFENVKINISMTKSK